MWRHETVDCMFLCRPIGARANCVPQMLQRQVEVLPLRRMSESKTTTTEPADELFARFYRPHGLTGQSVRSMPKEMMDNLQTSNLVYYLTQRHGRWEQAWGTRRRQQGLGEGSKKDFSRSLSWACRTLFPLHCAKYSASP